MTDLDLGCVAELREWERGEVVRHVRQTRHLAYGTAERADALFFRVPFGSPDVASTAPAAVFLEELAEAIEGGARRVRLPSMGKPESYRVSELLRQTAARPDHGAASYALGQLCKAFDDQARITGTSERDRAEWVALKEPRRGALSG